MRRGRGPSSHVFTEVIRWQRRKNIFVISMKCRDYKFKWHRGRRSNTNDQCSPHLRKLRNIINMPLSYDIVQRYRWQYCNQYIFIGAIFDSVISSPKYNITEEVTISSIPLFILFLFFPNRWAICVVDIIFSMSFMMICFWVINNNKCYVSSYNTFLWLAFVFLAI